MNQEVTPVIPESELEERFIRSSGPGGQNVNKVSTAVQLRFDVRNSPSLHEAVKHRLMRIAGHLLTTDGVLIITAQSHRTQDRNRQDARARLYKLVGQASVRPKIRKKTRPPASSKRKRLEGKQIQSKRKNLRRTPAGD